MLSRDPGANRRGKSYVTNSDTILAMRRCLGVSLQEQDIVISCLRIKVFGEIARDNIDPAMGKVQLSSDTL